MRSAAFLGWAPVAALLLAAGCAPTVQLEAPEEPIRIEVNVKIEHEVRVRVDRELEALMESEDGIF